MENLFLIGSAPPPAWILLAWSQSMENDPPGSVSVLLWGEGVYNSPDRFPGAVLLLRDAVGRGVPPGERALTDREAARWILGAKRVITCS
ncbi:MAG: hypothetical protein ACYC9S_06470 [Leptospirales bacterium]